MLKMACMKLFGLPSEIITAVREDLYVVNVDASPVCRKQTAMITWCLCLIELK